MIVGVTGLIGAGKDEVAKFFAKKGFHLYSLSDELRLILSKRGEEISRESLFRLGNELREKYGAGYLASLVRSKLQRPAVVTSIRHPAEVKELSKEPDFILINVTAPQKERYRRIVERGREGEANLSFEEFCERERRELSGPKNSQQLQAVLDMAEIVIENNSTLEDLYQKLELLYQKLNSKERR